MMRIMGCLLVFVLGQAWTWGVGWLVWRVCPTAWYPICALAAGLVGLVGFLISAPIAKDS